MVKWCKAGAHGDEAFQASWGYCMSVSLVFYDHGVFPWKGNGDPRRRCWYFTASQNGALADGSREPFGAIGEGFGASARASLPKPAIATIEEFMRRARPTYLHRNCLR
jgi:hypothetical protein